MISLLASSDSVHVSLTPQTRALAAIVALGFMALILELIRRHRLQERYSVIWFGAGLAMLIGAAFPGILEVIANLMGVRDTNVALFSLVLLLLLGLAINFSVIISRQSEQITRLAQENAIARAALDAGSEDKESTRGAADTHSGTASPAPTGTDASSAGEVKA